VQPVQRFGTRSLFGHRAAIRAASGPLLFKLGLFILMEHREIKKPACESPVFTLLVVVHFVPPPITFAVCTPWAYFKAQSAKDWICLSLEKVSGCSAQPDTPFYSPELKVLCRSRAPRRAPGREHPCHQVAGLGSFGKGPLPRGMLSLPSHTITRAWSTPGWACLHVGRAELEPPGGMLAEARLYFLVGSLGEGEYLRSAGRGQRILIEPVPHLPAVTHHVVVVARTLPGSV